MIRKLLVALALITAPGTAHAAWIEASTTHFVVYSNDKPESMPSCGAASASISPR